MPVARIIAADFDQARTFMEPLQALGYQVEIFDPQQFRLSPADLEIELEDVCLSDALQRAEQLAAEGNADIFVVPGALAAEAPAQPATAASSLRVRSRWAGVVRKAVKIVLVPAGNVVRRSVASAEAAVSRLGAGISRRARRFVWLLWVKAGRFRQALVSRQAHRRRAAHRERTQEIRGRERMIREILRPSRDPEAASIAVRIPDRSSAAILSPQWSSSTNPPVMAGAPLSRRERQWRTAAIAGSSLSLLMTLGFGAALAHRSSPPLPVVNPALSQQLPFGAARVSHTAQPAEVTTAPFAGPSGKRASVVATSRRARRSEDAFVDGVTVRHFEARPGPAAPQQNRVRKISDLQ